MLNTYRISEGTRADFILGSFTKLTRHPVAPEARLAPPAEVPKNFRDRMSLVLSTTVTLLFER